MIPSSTTVPLIRACLAESEYCGSTRCTTTGRVIPSSLCLKICPDRSFLTGWVIIEAFCGGEPYGTTSGSPIKGNETTESAPVIARTTVIDKYDDARRRRDIG